MLPFSGECESAGAEKRRGRKGERFVENNALFPPERIMRYAVYTFRGVTEDGLAFTRSFIALKNGYNVIVRFARYQEYAGIYERGS